LFRDQFGNKLDAKPLNTQSGLKRFAPLSDISENEAKRFFDLTTQFL